MDLTASQLKYLRLLSETYPSIGKASTEIINLTAIQNLPKGTEHFVSDLHGEYEAFLHILKNASGVIKLKIDDLFASGRIRKDHQGEHPMGQHLHHPELRRQRSLRDLHQRTCPLEPRISEWANPAGAIPRRPALNT